MAHSSNIIKKIAIGSTTYEIHDEQAVHTLADLAALGLDIEGAFIFKGTVATVADLPSEGNKPGYVYHVTANHSEYVWVKVDDATTGAWEEFGGSQPDWNQNDETASDYIKNKPFYEETSLQHFDITDKFTFTPHASNGITTQTGEGAFTLPFIFTIGETYKFIINGVE